MPANTPKRIAGVQWISSTDMAAIVDKRARSVLQISGHAFVRNRKNGKYARLDADDCPGIVELALIAPSPKEATTRASKRTKRSR